MQHPEKEDDKAVLAHINHMRGSENTVKRYKQHEQTCLVYHSKIAYNIISKFELHPFLEKSQFKYMHDLTWELVLFFTLKSD